MSTLSNDYKSTAANKSKDVLIAQVIIQIKRIHIAEGTLNEYNYNKLKEDLLKESVDSLFKMIKNNIDKFELLHKENKIL